MTDPNVRDDRLRARPPAANIIDAVGDTPLVAMDRLLERPDIHAWAKLEALNPGGSAKARPAAEMLVDALRDGVIQRGSTVVESTSGNMGVGLAQACLFHGLNLICVVDSRATDLNVKTMRAMGAEVHVVTRPDPSCGDLLATRMRRVERLIEIVPGSFWPDQYANASNASAHEIGTMKEIDETLEGEIDYLFVATSTTGTLSGCATYLRERDRQTEIVAVDAVGSVLFGGHAAPRRLPGFGAGVVTELSRHVEPDRLIRVSEIDSVVACRRLLQREAIFAGASAGAVAAALGALAPEMESGSRCAAIFHDGGMGYLDTVYDDWWVESQLGYGPRDVAAMTGRPASP